VLIFDGFFVDFLNRSMRSLRRIGRLRQTGAGRRRWWRRWWRRWRAARGPPVPWEFAATNQRLPTDHSPKPKNN